MGDPLHGVGWWVIPVVRWYGGLSLTWGGMVGDPSHGVGWWVIPYMGWYSG